jgi:hypothetical protein
MADETNKPDEGKVVELPKAAESTADTEAEALAKEAEMQMVAHLAGMIAPFCPNMDEPALLKLAAEGLAEQAQIHEQIMPTLMLSHEHCKQYPSIRLLALSANGQQGAVVAPKRLEGVEDCGPAVQQALITSLLLTPSARMVLKAWGYQLRFEQVQQDSSKPPPQIHLV